MPDVTIILNICCQDTHILIGLGIAHSFISHFFTIHANKELRLLDYCLVVATPARDSLMAKNVFQGYVIKVHNYDMKVDLIPLDIRDFDSIL